VNPITSVTQVLGSVASIFGMGSSLANQAVITHREMNPPQQQAQAQGKCPAGTKLVVLVKPNGDRELVCMQEQQP
jgi:hypothetical protein